MRKLLLIGILLCLVPTIVSAQSSIVDEREATWSSATNGGVAVPITAAEGADGTLSVSIWRAGCAVVWMTPSGVDVPSGQISFDVSYWRDNSSFVQISATNGDYVWVQSELSPHTTAFNGQEAGWRIPTQGMWRLRVRLAQPLTGTSTIHVGIRAVATECAPQAIVRQADPSRLTASTYSTALAGTIPTPVADSTLVSPVTDDYRVPFVRQDHPNRVVCYADNLGATLTELSNCSAHAGQALYITDIIAISTTATGGTGAIREGTGTNCATGTVGVLPVLSTARTFGYPANTAAPLVLSFKTPIRALTSNAICAIGVVTNTLNIMVVGFWDK